MFTKQQKDELLFCIQIRQETIEMDSDSADQFERIPDALNKLEQKILEGSRDFTEAEKKWMIEELDNKLGVSIRDDYQIRGAITKIRNLPNPEAIERQAYLNNLKDVLGIGEDVLKEKKKKR